MGRLFNAYLFKLRHDLTFKITLFIGLGVAIFMTLLYFLLEKITNQISLTGELMLITSISPAQNFGLAIPVNLITFTILEFSQGSIRNKIIAGHSKGKIYISLFLNGLIFSFLLITGYVLICFGLGSMFGGFHVEGSTITGLVMSPHYIPRLLICAVFCYLSITAFTIFFATLFRSIGPTIPVVLMGIVFMYLFGTLASTFTKDNAVIWSLRIFDPFYAIGSNEIDTVNASQTITNETFISGILSNVFYAALFFITGLLIFRKRDIK